jgi:hypothetical protein
MLSMSQRGLLYTIVDDHLYYTLALVYVCTMSFGLGLLTGFVIA